MQTKVLLIDNGSRNPQASLQLRRLAHALSRQSGITVDAVSLQHADKVDAQQLNGQAAILFYDYLRQHLQAGDSEFVVIPLFFGASGALTSFLPSQLELVRQEFPDVNLMLADVIYPLGKGEQKLVRLLFENVLHAADDISNLDRVVLVDHGSPAPEVTRVRESIAHELQGLLPSTLKLDQAVMERRAGKEYDFNGQLLQDYLLEQAQAGVKRVIVSMMFFLPGRHAGPGGDIAQICQDVMQQCPGFTVQPTALVGDHPLLIDILHDRLKTVLKQDR